MRSRVTFPSALLFLSLTSSVLAQLPTQIVPESSITVPAYGTIDVRQPEDKLGMSCLTVGGARLTLIGFYTDRVLVRYSAKTAEGHCHDGVIGFVSKSYWELYSAEYSREIARKRAIEAERSIVEQILKEFERKHGPLK